MLSEEAFELLATIKSNQKKNSSSPRWFDVRYINYWYEPDGDSFNDELIKSKVVPLNELIDKGLVKNWKDDNGYYVTPAGENYTHKSEIQPSPRQVNITNSFSNISGSNIASMSENVQQKIDISSLSGDEKAQLEDLISAVENKDNQRAQNIFDQMLATAPALALQILQIGLGLAGN